jgi:hypothetical protein
LDDVCGRLAKLHSGCGATGQAIVAAVFRCDNRRVRALNNQRAKLPDAEIPQDCGRPLLPVEVKIPLLRLHET